MILLKGHLGQIFSFMFGGTNDNFTEIKSIDKNKIAGFKLFF